MPADTSAEKAPVILIVDDQDVVVRLNEILLRRTGATVITARSGKEAIEKAMEHQPRIAVMDLQMPDMTGDAVTRFFRQKKEFASMKVVIGTSNGKEETRKRCMDAGADFFVTKPIQPNNLLDLIRSLLKR